LRASGKAVGQVIADQLTGTPVELPTFVCVLFVGVIISNALSLMVGYKIFARAIDVLGNVSLSLFLAMALMSLRLGELASIGLPVLLILAAQTIIMALYAILVTFRVMGSNTMRRYLLLVIVALRWGRLLPPLRTCRRSPNASAYPRLHFWSFRW